MEAGCGAHDGGKEGFGERGEVPAVGVGASGLSSISVGIGLLLDGRLYRGSHGRSGEYRSSRLAGLGMPSYHQVTDASDKEGAVGQIVGDIVAGNRACGLSELLGG